ncbi:MAG TPA: formate dehydrogenase accessory sulfurtransferase FdhD [Methanocella sp.]|uniref:formate dehydrogenase accessory sulfurtransferase FdhD n=1 Tax=Methanocella sp. TaxID=2052833 RepID=UPI002C805ED6|nr:formate dehydrogenase accessory sulfurtransferase FdhD [Methanocella sp.]HTY90450.1 formate dehydrogenase accessory sulfurtransferase FdhD [Methanocella sp.]
MESSPTASYEAVEVVGGRAQPVRMDVLRDRRIGLYVNGEFSASLSSTPDSLESLAYGYAIGEGMARDVGDILSVEVHGDKVYVRLKPPSGGVPTDARARERLDIRSLFYDILHLQEMAPAIYPGHGHFSVIFSAYGGLMSYAVGVDRHCVLWKAAGKVLLSGHCLSDTVAVCSGPVDSTMVEAAARAGIAAVLSPALPTDRAIESARSGHIVIMRFESPARACIYCGEEAISGIEFYRDRLMQPAGW